VELTVQSFGKVIAILWLYYLFAGHETCHQRSLWRWPYYGLRRNSRLCGEVVGITAVGDHPIGTLSTAITRQVTTYHSDSHQMKCLWKSSIIENCPLLLFCFCVHHNACIRVRKAHHSVQQASIHSQKKWTDAKIGKKSQVWLLIMELVFSNIIMKK